MDASHTCISHTCARLCASTLDKFPTRTVVANPACQQPCQSATLPVGHPKAAHAQLPQRRRVPSSPHLSGTPLAQTPCTRAGPQPHRKTAPARTRPRAALAATQTTPLLQARRRWCTAAGSSLRQGRGTPQDVSARGVGVCIWGGRHDSIDGSGARLDCTVEHRAPHGHVWLLHMHMPTSSRALRHRGRQCPSCTHTVCVTQSRHARRHTEQARACTRSMLVEPQVCGIPLPPLLWLRARAPAAPQNSAWSGCTAARRHVCPRDGLPPGMRPGCTEAALRGKARAESADKGPCSSLARAWRGCPQASAAA